ncbi:MAG: cytochrome c [Chitinophagaceae bacterium]|nr:MAG: cytochrome c [Chitinophagaceae bacterium]
MKPISLAVGVISCVTLFAYCSGSKKAAAPKEPVPTYTYTGNVQSLVTEKCSPCHIAGKGNKLSLDNMDAMKTNIDDIIRRIELNPGERGFMPFKHAKLSDTAINIIKTWKAEGFK